MSATQPALPPLARRIAAVATAAAVLALGAWGLRAALRPGASPAARDLASLPLPPGARPIPGQSQPAAGLARYTAPGSAASLTGFYLDALAPRGWRQRSLPREHAGEHTLAFSRQRQVCIITIEEDSAGARCVVTVFQRDIGPAADSAPWRVKEPGADDPAQRTTGAEH